MLQSESAFCCLCDTKARLACEASRDVGWVGGVLPCIEDGCVDELSLLTASKPSGAVPVGAEQAVAVLPCLALGTLQHCTARAAFLWLETSCLVRYILPDMAGITAELTTSSVRLTGLCADRRAPSVPLVAT